MSYSFLSPGFLCNSIDKFVQFIIAIISKQFFSHYCTVIFIFLSKSTVLFQKNLVYSVFIFTKKNNNNNNNNNIHATSSDFMILFSIFLLLQSWKKCLQVCRVFVSKQYFRGQSWCTYVAVILFPSCGVRIYWSTLLPYKSPARETVTTSDL